MIKTPAIASELFTMAFQGRRAEKWVSTALEGHHTLCRYGDIDASIDCICRSYDQGPHTSISNNITPTNPHNDLTIRGKQFDPRWRAFAA